MRNVGFFDTDNKRRLYLDPAHCLRYCKYQYQDQANGCDPFEHQCVKLFLTERLRPFHFFADRLRLNEEADADAGQNGDKRHQYAVADKIKKVQKPEPNDLKKTQRSEAQGNKGSHEDDINSDDQCGSFSAPMEFITHDGHIGFQK